MSKAFNSRTETTRDGWQTPDHIVEAFGKFDLDPCANAIKPTRLAAVGFTEAIDGLKQLWTGRVWMNPPYGKALRVWLKKLSDHGNGIALCPPRMGSLWFQDSTLQTFGAILFKRGPIAFLGDDMKPVTGNNADSIFIAFGKENVEARRNCGIKGKLWERTKP